MAIKASRITEVYNTDADFFVGKAGIVNLDTSIELSKKQISFLSLAAKVAESGDMDTKHGAVVVKGGRVISVGVNKWRVDPSMACNEKDYNPNLTYHAEAEAISRASGDLSGAVIFVARINKKGLWSFSRPCTRCMKLIKSAGIKKIIYTTGRENYELSNR